MPRKKPSAPRRNGATYFTRGQILAGGLGKQSFKEALVDFEDGTDPSMIRFKPINVNIMRRFMHAQQSADMAAQIDVMTEAMSECLVGEDGERLFADADAIGEITMDGLNAIMAALTEADSAKATKVLAAREAGSSSPPNG